MIDRHRLSSPRLASVRRRCEQRQRQSVVVLQRPLWEGLPPPLDSSFGTWFDRNFVVHFPGTCAAAAGQQLERKKLIKLMELDKRPTTGTGLNPLPNILARSHSNSHRTEDITYHSERVSIEGTSASSAHWRLSYSSILCLMDAADLSRDLQGFTLETRMYRFADRLLTIYISPRVWSIWIGIIHIIFCYSW